MLRPADKLVALGFSRVLVDLVMLIHVFAGTIWRWTDAHGGRSPSRIRVSKLMLDALKDDAKHFSTYKDNSPADGKMRIAGIPIEPDDKVYFVEIDP